MSGSPSLGRRVLGGLQSLAILQFHIIWDLFQTRKTTVNLPQSHIQNARLISDRRALLEHLPHGGVIAEVGVDQGGFSARILEVCKPAKLYLIDVWASRRYSEDKMEAVREKFAAEIQNGQVEMIRGDSVEEISRLPDAHLDWIYIDTTHEYHRTLRELQVAQRKVKAGGRIAGHDYSTGNMTKRLRYGVISAVNEFCVQNHWHLEWLTNEPHRYLTFVLVRALDAAPGAPRFK